MADRLQLEILSGRVENLTIHNAFPEGFLVQIQAGETKNIVQLYEKTVRKFPKSVGHVIGANELLERTTEQNIRATPDIAFATYMLNKYYKTYKKDGIAKKFVVSVDNGTENIEFYNLKGMTINDNVDTDNDYMLVSALMLNNYVKDLRTSMVSGLHPLSRIAMSDSNIAEYAKYLSENSEVEVTTTDVVKSLNLATLRKNHTLSEVTEYDPNLAAAVLIKNVMGMETKSTNLVTICKQNVGKISRAAGENFSEDKVIDAMNYLSTGGSPVDVQDIYNKFMARRTEKSFVARKERKVTVVDALKKAKDSKVGETSGTQSKRTPERK